MFACVHTNRGRQNIIAPIAMLLTILLADATSSSSMDNQVKLFRLGALTPSDMAAPASSGSIAAATYVVVGEHQIQQWFLAL